MASVAGTPIGVILPAVGSTRDIVNLLKEARENRALASRARKRAVQLLQPARARLLRHAEKLERQAAELEKEAEAIIKWPSIY
jgi:PHD/YefM family antitoxin component YafN of YafNO toxin-antitoxin module